VNILTYVAPLHNSLTEQYLSISRLVQEKEMEDRFKPPTFKQMEFAEKLGIGHLITMDISSRQAAKIIYATMRNQANMQSLRLLKKRIEASKQKMALLLKEGLVAGSDILYFGKRAIVKEVENCAISIWIEGVSKWVSPESITLNPYFENPDHWCPEGFIEIDEKHLAYLYEEEKSGVRIRDLFYPSITSRMYFVSSGVFAGVQERIKKQEEEEKEQKEEAKKLDIMDRSEIYCVQCGVSVQKSESEAWIKWGHRHRCKDCLTRPIKLSEWKFCRWCGKKFFRNIEEPIKTWAPRKTCYECKP